MAIDISTIYGTNGATTATTLNPALNAANQILMPQLPPDNTASFEEAMRRRAELEASREREAQRMRDLQFKAMQEQQNREQFAYNQRGNQGGEGNNRRSLLDAEREIAAAAQAQAMSRPAPMRMVHGAGITPGYTMDVNRMTGAQRQAFLPNSSQMTQGPSEGGTSYTDFLRESQYRNMAQSRGRG